MRPARLPAAPLLQAVGRHPAIGGPRHGWTEWLKRSVGTPGLRAYERARPDGWLTPQGIEQLCEVFGWHPRELYGDAYDTAALQGQPANLDPWAGS